MKHGWLPLERLSLGYKFDRDREVVSMIFINYFFILLFTTITVLLHTSGEKLLPVSYRYHFFVLLAVVNLLLIRIRRITLARILILVLTPALILILPPAAGILDNEFYFWFPYVPIAVSLIPHFILHPLKNRTALYITLFVYFLIGILIDNFLILMSDGSETIIPLVEENRFYYNLIPIVIFLFVNVALGLLFTNSYRNQEILRKQQSELLQAEKMASLGTLTAGIAHEINNPLNFISGSLHALNTLIGEFIRTGSGNLKQRELIRGQIEKIVETSFEGVKRVSDIVSSLRFFTSPGKAGHSVVELERIFYNVWLEIEPKLPEHIELTRDISNGLAISCYPEHLQQAFVNIIQNAMEAIEAKPPKELEKIHVLVRKELFDQQPFVRISISNTGPSIPEEQISHVFEPFYSSREEGPGKGLGLTISYMIVSEHRGRIEVHNEKGQVVIDTYLPLEPGD